ncbi:hypothetical protein ACFWAR_27100 [Streptomyces sp. NPDC059917]|uniref:hypothetical protein n=1 Tax=Streptomyces sp. NPDC059917 TaxID=3347002 RepID=UPI00365EFB21
MDESDLAAARFEEQRTHPRAVARRMLGSPAEAEDAVREARLGWDRSDTGGVARRALTFRRPSPCARPAPVDGAPGAVTVPDGRPVAVTGFTVSGALVAAIDILADPVRLAHLDVAVLED